MRDIHSLEDDFLYSPIDETNCESQVNKFKAIYSTALLEKLSKSEVYCVQTNLRFLKVSDFAMKHFVYINSNHFSQRQSSVSSAVEHEWRKAEQVLLKMCLEEDLNFPSIADTFDLIYSSYLIPNTETAKSDSECIRKFAIEKRLVDVNAFKPETESENSLQLDCNETLEKYRNFANKQVQQDFDFNSNCTDHHRQWNDCVQERIVTSSFFDVFATVKVLGELRLSQTGRDLQRKDFIKFTKNLYQSIARC